MGDDRLLTQREDFDQWVADALRQLYDTSMLTRNPLCELLASEENSPVIRSQRVRSLLLEAIRAQRPSEQTPQTSRDRRLYRLLELRYIEGRSVSEAMQQLGIERSQFYRDHAEALQFISDRMWSTCQADQHEAPGASEESGSGALRTEITRLSQHSHTSLASADELLRDLRALLETLCVARDCSLRIRAEQVPAIRLPVVLVRQAVLLSAQTALALHDIDELLVTTYEWGDEHGIRVIAHLRPGSPSPTDSHLAEQMLSECQTMLSRIGGDIHVLASDTTWEAKLEMPEETRYTALLVDDNERVADLFGRYLVNSNWRLVAARDGVQARRIIAEMAIDVILLDVLLPGEDGWTLFAELRQNPQTAETPIIICSVLRQPGLADALGAHGYLPKPIGREVLLGTLRQLE
ncbi:MAG: response regulator [Anaerolineae bacterium]